MQVILLERVEKLGQMGDVVKVKDGFARNFLLPKKKALRATEATANISKTQKSQLEARNLSQKKEAEGVAGKLDGKVFTMLRQAGESGQLYGSVSTRDIADVITAGGFNVSRGQVPLDKAIKTIGLHDVNVVLHPGSARQGHHQRRAHRGRGRAPSPRRKRACRSRRRRGRRSSAKRRGPVRGRRSTQGRGRVRGLRFAARFAKFREDARVVVENGFAPFALSLDDGLIVRAVP